MELAREQAAGAKKRTREGLLGVLLDALRNIRIARRQRSLHLCETLQLGERRQLLLIEWESRRYLIGATQQGLTVLDSVPHSIVNEAEAVQ